MILAANVGNTSFALSFGKNCNMTVTKYAVDSIVSHQDFTKTIDSFMKDLNISSGDIKGAILASVKPKLTQLLVQSLKDILDIDPLIVNPDMDMSLDLSNYDTTLIGNDRIAICEAALSVEYISPIVVFDFGTATTINVLEGSKFLGGSILAGFMMGLRALSKDTEQLNYYEISSQVNLIGENTRECILSGAVFGNASILDGMVQQLENHLKRKLTVLITGGNASFILPHCKTNVIYEPNLLMKGLNILYEKNI